MRKVSQDAFMTYVNSHTRGGGLHTADVDGVRSYSRDGVLLATKEDKIYLISEEIADENR